MSDSTNSEILLKLTAIDSLTPIMTKALQAMEANSAKMTAALDKVGESTSKTEQHTEGLHGGVVSLAAGLEVAEFGVELLHKGFELLTENLGDAIQVSLAAEQAQTRLTGSLISAGKYTAELNSELNEYAETQQRQNGVSAEAVKGIMATGLNMGLSAQKAQELVAASQKLAAATGTDVQTAFQKLQGSLAGHARGLATSVAGVGDLSASQLKAGAGIDLVNKSLTAQFQIYQGSFAAGLARAHEGVEDLYKTFGNLITQNPAVKEALGQFATALGQLNTWVSSNKTEMQSWVSQGVLAMIDSLAALNLIFDAIYRGGVIAFNGIEGALQTLALGVVSIVDGPFALLYKSLSYLPGEKGKEFGAAADAIGKHMADMANNVNKSAANIDDAMKGPTATSQTLEKNILKVRDAVSGAIATEGAHKKALEDTSEAMSAQNAAALGLQKTYAGFTYGTLQQREALQLQVSDRDKDLKDFTAYLDGKQRLAVSAAQEQAMAVHAITAKAVTGVAGGSDVAAQAQVAIDAETKKQAALSALRAKGVLSQTQFDQAMLASKQKAQAAELSQDQAFAKAQADLLGTSQAGFQKRQVLAQQQFNLELQQKKVRARQEGLSETQIHQMAEAANEAHLANMKKQEIDYYDSQMQTHLLLGEDAQAYYDHIHALEVTHGAVMATLIATEQTQQFKAIQTGLGQASTLMQSHHKGVFMLGKAAAIANAGVDTGIAIANALAVPPFPLGLALAAVAGAAGATQIENIASQQFNPGGQADEGMDNIPASLSGKSFVLSQGERVVQPEANKDLTGFLAKQGGSGGAAVSAPNYTFQYYGNGSKEDAKDFADSVIKEIRARSDRGTPIMSSKGLTP